MNKAGRHSRMVQRSSNPVIRSWDELEQRSKSPSKLTGNAMRREQATMSTLWNYFEYSWVTFIGLFWVPFTGSPKTFSRDTHGSVMGDPCATHKRLK